MSFNDKITDLNQLAEYVQAMKTSDKTVAHCHGVFDLLHIGHIKHLEAAAGMADTLVVTITPDHFVNKGPHRPAFSQRLRAEALAALECVDRVAVNEWPTAVEVIHKIKPSLFIKGVVQGKEKRDFTDAIKHEEEAVIAEGGRLVLTDEETYSASTLINRHLDIFSPAVKTYLERFTADYSPDDVIDQLKHIESLKILTVGETILDEYQFCQVMGKANKDPVLAVRLLSTECYTGGILAVANHIAQFCKHVGLMSQLGALDSKESFIRDGLASNIHAMFTERQACPTIIKRRFLEEYLSTKLFELYEISEQAQMPADEQKFMDQLEFLLPQYDAVVVVDYGHGLFTQNVVEMLCRADCFLAVNTQVNAGNRGFNTISKYSRADYVSLGEPELRLEARSTSADLREMTKRISEKLGCRNMLVTSGKEGCVVYDRNHGFVTAPAFSVKLVDRIGAGDAALALTAPLVYREAAPEIIAFIANVAGAEACATMGNKLPIQSSGFFRHIKSLLQ